MQDAVYTAWIVSQGEELLTGQTLDTNAHHLAAALTGAGLRVLGASTAGDDEAAIAKALADAARNGDVVVCTGGLGPTSDDHTAAAAAAAFGSALRLDAASLAAIEGYYAAAARPMPAPNRKQAMIPETATALPNAHGTAPGFVMQAGAATLYCLPGPPREMRPMLVEAVLPDIARRLSPRPPRRHFFRTLGAGESALQAALAGLIPELGRIELGFRAKIPEVELKLVGPPDVPDADWEIAVGRLRAALGKDCFSEDEHRGLGAVVGDLLLARKETLAIAESCTGGLVTDVCVREPGSSRWFERSWTTYSNVAKTEELGVPAELIAAHGAVSEPVVLAMAEGARARSGANWGVATSGVAGPAGGTPEKPVGTVCFAVAGPGVSRARTLRAPGRARDAIRKASAEIAIDMLRRQLLRM
jgi:nicotinamide-nucleotide amidase